MKIRLFDSKLEKFIASLEKSTIAKVLRIVDLLEMFGSRLGLPHSKKVNDHLFELRIRGKQEIRILYAFKDGEALLLHGFIKKENRTLRRELNIALQKLSTLD